MKRHSAEVSGLQAAATAERKGLEQQLSALRDELAALQQQDDQRQQQLELFEQDYAALEQQLAEQREAAEQQVEELQRLLQGAEAELQQFKLPDPRTAAAAGRSSSCRDHQQQQRDDLAAAMASDSEGADDAQDGLVVCHQEGLANEGEVDSRPSTPATAAVEHALRAQLGIANAEVARLRHELDVARASRSEERQLTGAEIMRLQQELSEAAASASSTGAAAGAAGEAEVTSQLQYQQPQLDVVRISSNSWHSLHAGTAREQQGKQSAAGGAETGADVAAHYEARLQDQAETITSLQQQLKQQQQLLATLRRPERRVSAQ